MPNEIGKYIQLIQERYALDISMYDRSFLEKSIQSRISSTMCGNFEAYLDYLLKTPDEFMQLVNQLKNSYSEFFRNPLTFAYLAQVVLPQLIEKKKNSQEKEIRVWSAACAAGQEAYSLAILCDELMDHSTSDVNCRIFATDISEDVIFSAQKGIFPVATLGKVSLKRIQTYFTCNDEVYTIIPSMRERIDFSVFDLLSDNGSCPPASIYGNFDLVFCSNLLFYYKPECRNQMLEKVENSLAKGGYIITGEAEREILKGYNYREVFINSAIFQKRL